MLNLFNQNAFDEVVAQIAQLDYRGDMLRLDYEYPDWFAKGEIRQVPAVAFAQTPVSYETALIGVVSSNALRERALIDQYRGLCAPVMLEVDGNEIREWSVSKNEGQHGLVECFSFDNIKQFFIERTRYWKPNDLFRYKNIGTLPWTGGQTSLFAGLIPEVEEQIQDTLEPLLRRAMADTIAEYKRTSGHEPREDKLFKLIFSILTAKVFYDRRVNGFVSLNADENAILTKLGQRYKDDELPRLLNRATREVSVAHIWSKLDFRHLSVEVLAQMWSSMLIDRNTRKRLGIHRTSRTLVRYIVDKMEFRYPGDEKRIIFEPCSGSSAFLIGAMNQLRPTLFGMPPSERHQYFKKRLVGMERDPFGVQISKLALTLADFPNAADWEIYTGDVFEEGALTKYLKQAGAVLCNPPFRDFDPEERPNYNLSSTHKPVELLARILQDLHPSAVLGFVLPRAFADGAYYRQIRAELVKRFATVDITVLPDKAFDADTEPALLVATEPFQHNKSKLTFSRVRDTEADWKRFESLHIVNGIYHRDVSPSEAARTLFVPDMPEVWEYLVGGKVLREIADLHRGLQWKDALTMLTDAGRVETGNRENLVRPSAIDGFHIGVPPQAHFSAFQKPDLAYLSHRPHDQKDNSYLRQWDEQKVILNKSARSRGPWRISAFPDAEGLSCYQTYIAAWPLTTEWDVILLSAVLNSPLANAFVSAREGKTDVTIETLKEIPMPVFTPKQVVDLHKLVNDYQGAIVENSLFHHGPTGADPEKLLLEIDALILDAYNLPPRLEHQLLKYFEGQNDKRPTKHPFSDYLPPDAESYFSLSMRLSPKFYKATAGSMREYLGIT